MKKFFLFLLVTAVYLTVQAQTAKVDLNMEGRGATEVNEPGYTGWWIARVHTASLTVDKTTFTLTATGPSAISTFRASWSKSLVQSPNFMRLVNDGIAVDNDTMLANPGKPAIIELKISGLPVGHHTLQSYHNLWSDTAKTDYAPISVFANGVQVHSKVKRSAQVKSVSLATCLLTPFEITEAGQDMIIQFVADTAGFVPMGTKTADRNVCIDAFELNTDDASKQAHDPYPTDLDQHAVADSGKINLSWMAAISKYAKTHSLYFGTDSVAVATATTSGNLYKGTFPVGTTQFQLEGLSNLNRYFWRVDETDSAGVLAKGRIWSFRPRHLAFVGAEGYGRYALGGRQGKVVYVTNLNDDGPGSFRAAATSNDGPRTILFNVSGIIELQGRLIINPNVTIAGQTAPSKGICFKAAPVGINGESVCRFIRVRLGAGTTYDGLGMAGADNGIVDHCSISWTIDEAFSSRGAKNITLQRSLVSEALNCAGHSNYPAGTEHGYAGTISGKTGSYHHNLLAHCQGRNWSMGDAIDGKGVWVSKLDIFNNVVYNYGGRATDGEVHMVNFVNNYYKKGAATTIDHILTVDIKGYGTGTEQAYYKGNIIQNSNGTFLNDGTSTLTGRRINLESGLTMPTYAIFPDTVLFPSDGTLHTARDAYKSVLSDAGCNLPMFDEHDQRIVRETLNGTYTYVGSVTGKKGLIDHQDDAGGYENYPAVTRPAGYDTDLDGLPDWWEKMFGTNPNSAANDFSDSNADADNDGYTNLEEFLEWMAVPHYYLNQGEKDTINLAAFNAGYTLSPTYAVVQSDGMTTSVNGASLQATAPGTGKGIRYVTYKVTDSEGSSENKTIGFSIGADLSTGMTEQYSDATTVTPTVFTSGFDVTIQDSPARNLRISLQDLSGKVCFEQEMKAVIGLKSFRIDVPAGLPSQLYLLSIRDSETGQTWSVHKMVKN
jgi:hypothetical protein